MFLWPVHVSLAIALHGIQEEVKSMAAVTFLSMFECVDVGRVNCRDFIYIFYMRMTWIKSTAFIDETRHNYSELAEVLPTNDTRLLTLLISIGRNAMMSCNLSAIELSNCGEQISFFYTNKTKTKPVEFWDLQNKQKFQQNFGYYMQINMFEYGKCRFAHQRQFVQFSNEICQALFLHILSWFPKYISMLSAWATSELSLIFKCVRSCVVYNMWAYCSCIWIYVYVMYALCICVHLLWPYKCYLIMHNTF